MEKFILYNDSFLSKGVTRIIFKKQEIVEIFLYSIYNNVVWDIDILQYKFCLYIQQRFFINMPNSILCSYTYNYFSYNLLELHKKYTCNKFLYKDNLTSMLINSEKTPITIKGSKIFKAKKNNLEKSVQNDLSTVRIASYTRPPIVTILGHVNHGKTTLLDSIRKTFVAKNEYDNITQHLSSYIVDCEYGKLTFLDTPGHSAFKMMRELSVKFTDIILLLIAVDDGVMPQTIEILNYIEKLKKPIIVVLNKVDKGDYLTNIDKINNELVKFGIVSEYFGGDSIFVEVSAKTGLGISTLLNLICLQGEMLELTTRVDGLAKGGVIEVKIDKGVGVVVTVIVLKGTLEKGMFFLSGNVYGKIRFLLDSNSCVIDKAGPSVPCSVIGLNEVPVVGSIFEVVEDEKTAKRIILDRDKVGDKQVRKKYNVEDLFSNENSTLLDVFNIILKVDVFGSIAAIEKVLTEGVASDLRIKIIKKNIGDINDSDVDFAVLTKSIVVGFNVKVSNDTSKLAYKEKIDINIFRSVYNIVEFVKKKITSVEEDTTIKENNLLGTAIIKNLYVTDKVKKIAGCFVEKGVIKKNNIVLVRRDNEIIYKGTIDSLNYYKNVVLEVVAPKECGIIFKDFNSFKIGDVVQTLKNF